MIKSSCDRRKRRSLVLPWTAGGSLVLLSVLCVGAGAGVGVGVSAVPVSAQSSASASATTTTNAAKMMIDWINAHEDGYFNPNQQVRLQDPEHPESSQWMLFATEPIQQDEILATIPWDLIVKPNSNNSNSKSENKSNDEGDGDGDGQVDEDDDEDDDEETVPTGELNCETTRTLADALSSNDTTSPFVKYLTQLPNQLAYPPSAWSDAGKALLVELLGGVDQQFPPGEPVSMLDEWFGACQGTEDGVHAATLLMQRGLYDTYMVPAYDWYTHRNGAYYNIAITLEMGKYLQITARKAIAAGEPLHNSYDLCDDCDEDAVDQGYGTSELFRDYGLVEEYPQRWTLQPNTVVFETEGGEISTYAPVKISFELVESGDNDEDNDDDDDDDDYNNNNNNNDGTHTVRWDSDLSFDDRGRNYVRRLFRKELRRLYRFQNIHYDLEAEEPLPDHVSDIPIAEWKSIRAYYHAVRTALQYAIHSLVNEDDETGGTCHDDWSANEGVCDSVHLDVYGIHYDDLKYEEDNLDYIFPTCATTQLLEFQEYNEVEELQTNYQRLWFMDREDDDDMCMNLEQTLQICSNYRPHYHEFFVHFPARFIDKIERVIFIGGGDSMLLHEVLKYPTLQKVVGLELDQQVTRKSFQHFQSQPHWDNDKVEWWYGDATKSLSLLPQDYWGSFDLVLVDLSETVMSFGVTKTMDIFSALSLLLKPEGIMVKNEPYIEQFSEFFDYSIHIFYGTPKICTQVLVMGSNQVDFLHHPTKDHPVERLLLEPLDFEDDERDHKLHYKYMHDYRKTEARLQGKCHDGDDAITTEHGRKAGLMEILEAENATFAFSTDSIEKGIHGVLRDHGLSPLSPPSTVPSASPAVVVVLKEGYIVARVNPELHHVGFDINLWGAFPKMESLRAALLKLVGSQSSSFYRVVVGGMHGSNTWDEDKDAIGIQVTQSRNCQETAIQDTPTEKASLVDQAMTAAMQRSIQFIPSRKMVAAVVCGFQKESGTPSCATANALAEIGGVQVIRFWSCPGLEGHWNETFDFDESYECEKAMLQQLTDRLVVGKDRIDLFVVDTVAPFLMGQIFNSIWSIAVNREAFLSEQHVFAAFVQNPSTDLWRNNFIERYRKESHPHPVSRAELTLTAGQHQLSYHLLAVHDRYFFQDLHNMEVELKVDLKDAFDVEAKTITGGMYYYDSEYDIKVFSREAYDVGPALRQAKKQQPLGRQSIFQFEFATPAAEGASDAATMPTLEELNEHLRSTMEEVGIDAKKVYRWDTYSNVGNGAAVVTIFHEGLAVMVWDGLHHLDINLYNKNQDKAYADSFVDTFAAKSSLMKTLRDDQPRGPGRVVQFEDDMERDGERWVEQ